MRRASKGGGFQRWLQSLKGAAKLRRVEYLLARTKRMDKIGSRTKRLSGCTATRTIGIRVTKSGFDERFNN